MPLHDAARRRPPPRTGRDAESRTRQHARARGVDASASTASTIARHAARPSALVDTLRTPARLHPRQPRRARDPARLAHLRALVDPRRRAHLRRAAAARPRGGGARVPRLVRAATSTPTARCRAASTGAAPTPCPSTTARRVHLPGRRVLPLHARRGFAARACGRTWRARSTTSTRCAHAAHRRRSTGRPTSATSTASCRVDQPRGLLGAAGALLLGRLLRAARLQGRRRPGRARSGDEPSATRFADAPRRVRARPRRLDRGAMARARRSTTSRVGRARRLRPHLDHDRALAPAASWRSSPRRRSRARSSATGEFVARAARRRSQWEAYTPYELRNVGAFVRLGWRERAHELLDCFLGDSRPPGWKQWAEVVGPRRARAAASSATCRTPGWARASSRSVLDIFAYERESDRALVRRRRHSARVGHDRARRRDRESADARTVRSPTRCDHTGDGAVKVEIASGLRIPPGGIAVALPLKPYVHAATLDGRRGVA